MREEARAFADARRRSAVRTRAPPGDFAPDRRTCILTRTPSVTRPPDRERQDPPADGPRSSGPVNGAAALFGLAAFALIFFATATFGPALGAPLVQAGVPADSEAVYVLPDGGIFALHAPP